MAGDGSSYEIDIPVKAAGVEPAAAAVARLATELTASQAAYKEAATGAEKASKAAERLTLAVDSQSAKAASAAEKYGLFSTQYQKASDKLAQLTQRQAEAVEKSAEAAAAMTEAAEAADHLQAKAQEAADAQKQIADSAAALATAEKAAAAELSNNLAKYQDMQKAAANAAADKASKEKKAADDSKKAAKEAADAQKQAAADQKRKTNDAAEALGKLGGPVGLIGQKFFSTKAAVGKLSEAFGEGSGEAIAAAAGIASAAAIAVAAVAAITLAAIAGVAALASWAIGLADAARSQGLLSQGIARTVAGGAALDSKIADLTSQLPTTRDELLGIAKGLADGGLRGDDLTNALQNSAIAAAKLKFGPDFQAAMLSLPFQTARLQTSFSKLFSGLKIEKLLEAFSKLVDLFDEAQPSGKALKSVFESLFQPLVDGLTALLPKAVTFFLQLEIMALKALIFIKPYGAVLEAIGIGFAIVIVAVVALAALLVAFGVAMTAVVALIVALPFYITDAFNAAVSWLSNLSFTEIGTNLIQGLIDGILGAGAGVLKAITGVVGGAVDAAKAALGIASPSKVFAEIGMHTAAGMEEGIDDGAKGVQGSMKDMVEPPAAAGGASSSGGAGTTYVITINGGGDAQSNVAAFREWLASIGAQAGTAVPA